MKSSRVCDWVCRNCAGHARRREAQRAELVTSVEQRVQPERQPRRQRAQPVERQEHAGDVRLARERVVADRQELALPAEQHLLVCNEPREPNRVDRNFGREQFGGRPGGCPPPGPLLPAAPEEDDLHAALASPGLTRSIAPRKCSSDGPMPAAESFSGASSTPASSASASSSTASISAMIRSIESSSVSVISDLPSRLIL